MSQTPRKKVTYSMAKTDIQYINAVAGLLEATASYALRQILREHAVMRRSQKGQPYAGSRMQPYADYSAPEPPPVPEDSPPPPVPEASKPRTRFVDPEERRLCAGYGAPLTKKPGTEGSVPAGLILKEEDNA